jgi:hypothetical protein
MKAPPRFVRSHCTPTRLKKQYRGRAETQKTGIPGRGTGGKPQIAIAEKALWGV